MNNNQKIALIVFVIIAIFGFVVIGDGLDSYHYGNHVIAGAILVASAMFSVTKLLK